MHFYEKGVFESLIMCSFYLQKSCFFFFKFSDLICVLFLDIGFSLKWCNGYVDDYGALSLVCYLVVFCFIFVGVFVLVWYNVDVHIKLMEPGDCFYVQFFIKITFLCIFMKWVLKFLMICSFAYRSLLFSGLICVLFLDNGFYLCFFNMVQMSMQMNRLLKPCHVTWLFSVSSLLLCWWCLYVCLIQ